VLSKYVKLFIIVCLALVVIAPWLLTGKRHRQTGLGSGSDGARIAGEGDCDDGGHDGGHAGGDGGG
jgi:hypothetical protein